MTLLALYLAEVLFEGRPGVMPIAIVAYLSILAVYFLALRKESSQAWLILARVISCVNIVAFVLISLYMPIFSIGTSAQS